MIGVAEIDSNNLNLKQPPAPLRRCISRCTAIESSITMPGENRPHINEAVMANHDAITRAMEVLSLKQNASDAAEQCG